MTTDTHDTAAALEAAIDALINAEDVDTRAIVASERGEPGPDIDATERNACGARRDLHRAITAHVEAEVARRLAAAPGVDEAIGDFDDACSSLMRVRCEETPPDAREPAAWDESLLEVYRERKAALLAAIAADKARAVEASRPTPDEARRLVEAYGDASGTTTLTGISSAPQWVRERALKKESEAKVALLRALGVEA